MPEPYYADDLVTLHLGDCRDVIAAMDAASVDAVVCDPPYELGFMGRSWDASGIAYDVGVWREALRVLKPGGHLLAFGGTRTYHRLACGIEDAGFEIRDSLHWLYGSGFPKSLNAARAIDRAMAPGEISPPVSAEGAPWEGWGTALKPAHEPIVVARKPLAGTVAGNVLEWGTGALNVDGCRVGATGDENYHRERANGSTPEAAVFSASQTASTMHRRDEPWKATDAGRWPPNLLLVHSASCNGTCAPGCPVAGLDGQSGSVRESGSYDKGSRFVGSKEGGASIPLDGIGSPQYTDAGGASRFFPQFTWDPEHDLPFMYCAKAPKSERPRLPDGTSWPTVKPLALIRWLVRLVTPPGGTVFDPFAGTGTTGQASALEGFRCILAERDPAAAELARIRLSKPTQQQMTLT